MIKLIVFDAAGVTYCGGYSLTIKELSKKTKIPHNLLRKIIYTKYFNLAATRKITQKEAWVKATKELNLGMSWKELKNFHYSLMVLNKPLINLIKKIRNKTKIVLLTKNTRSQLYETDKIMHFKKYFHNIINTWEINLPKASPKTIHYVLKKFRVKPNETIYIDDQEENLEEAKKIGVNVILYKNQDKFKQEFNKIIKKND